MNQIRIVLCTVITTVLIILSVNPYNSLGQEIDLTANDTTVINPETIDLSEISRKSAELELEAKEIIMQAIDQEEVERLKKNNQVVIHYMDSLLARETFVNMTTLSSRNLNSKSSYWKLNLKTVTNQRSALSDVFSNLNKSHQYLKNEMVLWEKTSELIQGDELAKAVRKHFEDNKLIIDTTKMIVDKKSAAILKLLDRITNLEVKIELLNAEIDKVIQEKQESIFDTDQPSLLNFKYGDKNNWLIPKSYINYYKGNYVYFKNYLGKHINILIFQILLILMLFILFLRLNKLKFQDSKKEGALYVSRLKVLISNPFSAALIIGLFASVFIYPYRPIMFLDITNILVTIPIVIILVHILDRKYYVYAFVFGFSVFLYVIVQNLPVYHIFSRLILLFITLLHAATLLYFILNRKETKGLKGSNLKLFTYFAYLLLVISFVGVFANLIGKISLATYIVEATLGILLISVIIAFLLVVTNGLIILFIDSKYGDKLNIIKNNKSIAKRKIVRIFNMIAVLLLIFFTLKVFKIQSNIFSWFSEFLLEERNLGSIAFTWGNIFIFFVVIYLSIVVSNLIRVLLEKDVLSKMHLKKGLPYTISLMVKYALVTAGLFIAVSAAGIPTNNLTVIIGAFGVGIGFGLQNIFNNLVSGLILLFERPIQLGDTIEVGTLMGNVKSIGIRSSNIRTFDGAEIIVPNGNLISNEVINWTLSDDRRRIELIVGVSYNADPVVVKDILMNVIKSHQDIIDNPEPNVFFQNLGESSLDFRMLFWIKEYNQWVRIQSEILFKVFDELKAAGIEIPFPQRDLHLRSIKKDIQIIEKNDNSQ